MEKPFDRIRPAYFVRGEEPPGVLDPRYELMVVQWRHLWESDSLNTISLHQHLGIEVYVHTPVCYINPTATPEAHQRIAGVLNETSEDGKDGWLRDPAGNVVMRGNDPNRYGFVWPADPETRRALLDIHLDIVGSASWEPNGLFLDFIRDRTTWMEEFDGLSTPEKRELDAAYKDGMYQLALGFAFGCRAFPGMKLYGNGLHSCHVLDGIAYENFPNTHYHDGRKDMDVSLTGPYGKHNWMRFRRPPMFFPADARDHAYDAPKKRIVEMVAFARGFCLDSSGIPSAILFDNSGYIFDVLGM